MADDVTLPSEILLDANEVLLDGIKFSVLGGVQARLVSALPGKITIGDATRGDQTIASEWVQSTWHGGLGINQLQEDVHIDRFDWSTCETRFKNFIMLPPYATDIGNPSGATTTAVSEVAEYNGTLWAAHSTNLYSMASGGTWTLQGTLQHIATDMCVFGGKLFVATTEDYTYVDNSSGTAVLTNVATTPAKYWTIYDNKLLKADNGGTIYQSTTGAASSWGSDYVTVPVPAGHVSDLVTWRLADDSPAPYVVTREGLWALDMYAFQALLTDLQTTPHPYVGFGSVPYSDGNLYITGGLEIHRYGNRVISTIGPNQDDGLPAEYRGHFTKLIPAFKWVVGLIDNSLLGSGDTSDVEEWDVAMETQFSIMPFVVEFTGQATVLAYTGSGWHTLFTSQNANAGTGCGCIWFDTVALTNKLIFSADGTLYSIEIPDDTPNPLKDLNARFALTGTHITPWFDSNFPEVPKDALSFKMRTKQVTSTETVTVYYGLNDDESTWTLLGTLNDQTIDDDGIVEFSFGKPGIEFYSIRFKFVLGRDADNNNLTPVIIMHSLRFQRVLKNKWGYTLRIDLNDEYNGYTPRQLRRALRTLINKVVLVQFIYNDDLTESEYVRVTGASDQLSTGMDSRSTFVISMVGI